MSSNPLLLVIFGISGDLAKRKLMPALYRLIEQAGMPQEFKIIGISRQADYSVDTLFTHINEFLKEPNSYQLDFLKDHTTIVHNGLQTTEDAESLRNTLEQESQQLGSGTQRIYYLSIPPAAFPQLMQLLGDTSHNTPFANEFNAPRLLVEKPFGYDSESAAALIASAHTSFSESQIYRIDHYLAKETAQNILAFRFKNSLFESIWNDRHIADITIVAHEQIDIEGRANFYEQTGALRDIIQSHLIQLLALVMMEEPTELTSPAIHNKKLELLQAIAPANPKYAVRGQYDGYREAVSNPNSSTETFARVALHVDSEQWRNTTIMLETGKALDQKATFVQVTFRAHDADGAKPNILTFELQPNEGISLELQAKQPGLANDTQPVRMEFDYGRSFDTPTAEAYERVIMDAIRGDQTLFASGEEIMAAWRAVDPVLHDWINNGQQGIRLYKKGDHAASVQ